MPILALAAAALVGCSTTTELGPVPPSASPLPADSAVLMKATVRYLNLEGGCWVLATANGRYEPVNLPVAFRVDGRAVTALVRGAPDMASTCMVAPLVRLDTIAVRH